jgi:predicted 3-demethylubiquinone-9 3-methyltransferase (glyoxalase superfamily)
MTITPFLWFDTQAEEAMNYYLSVFKNAKSKAVHRAQGRVMSVEFELEGQQFMALNGGTPSKFTESTGCGRPSSATAANPAGAAG